MRKLIFVFAMFVANTASSQVLFCRVSSGDTFQTVSIEVQSGFSREIINTGYFEIDLYVDHTPSPDSRFDLHFMQKHMSGALVSLAAASVNKEGTLLKYQSNNPDLNLSVFCD
jgi:hypothetical protein